MSYATLKASAATHDWHNCATLLLRELWLRPAPARFALALRALRQGVRALTSPAAVGGMEYLLDRPIADLMHLVEWPELEPEDPAEASYELAVDAFRLLLDHQHNRALATINAVVTIYQSITAMQLRLLGTRLKSLNSAGLRQGLRETKKSSDFGETAWTEIDTLLQTKYPRSAAKLDRVRDTSLSRESLEYYLRDNMFLPVGILPPGIG